MKQTQLTLPSVRTVEPMRPLTWLARGFHDMVGIGWLSFAHGLVLALGGIFIVLVTRDRFWLLAGALSGFMVIAPVLATSLYALSRAKERGEATNFSVVLKTWLNWQDKHINKWSNDYWCMAQFGALLALASTGWVLMSAALITLLAPLPITGPVDFLRYVVLAKEGWLFELWLAMGGFLAAPLFASSVISMPLLLDRRVSVLQAVVTSWKTVLENPLPMGVWAALIMGLTTLGLGTLFLGLLVFIPILGHASWHAYRDLVDATELPERDDTAPTSNTQGAR